MHKSNDLRLFTARFERGKMSREAYKAALNGLAKTADTRTQAHIKRRLNTLQPQN